MFWKVKYCTYVYYRHRCNQLTPLESSLTPLESSLTPLESSQTPLEYSHGQLHNRFDVFNIVKWLNAGRQLAAGNPLALVWIINITPRLVIPLSKCWGVQKTLWTTLMLRGHFLKGLASTGQPTVQIYGFGPRFQLVTVARDRSNSKKLYYWISLFPRSLYEYVTKT